MRRVQARGFRRERANDLRRLADELDACRLLRDPGPLIAAAAQCEQRGTLTRQREETWSYAISRLTFADLPRNALFNLRPEDASDLLLTLDVDASGLCLPDGCLDDPFISLSVDIVVEGLSVGTGHELVCAWHLDRHKDPQSRGNSGEGTAVDADRGAVHPMYHFQYGGRRVWEKEDFGCHMLLEPPRFPHPPLDVVLAIDFVLANYFPYQWRDLRADNDTYTSIVARYQKRIWLPYAAATASAWSLPGSGSPWPASVLWPLLVG